MYGDLSEMVDIARQRDELIDEKESWTKQLEADNASLLQLLVDVKSAKDSFLQKLEELELEKNRLRTRETGHIESDIELRLSTGLLGLAGREHMPESQRSAAEIVHRRLTGLAVKCRSNQLDVMDHVKSCVSTVENAFLSNDNVKVETELGKLERLSSASPGNIFAAEALSADLKTALLTSLADADDDSLVRLMQRNVKVDPKVCDVLAMKLRQNLDNPMAVLKASVVQLKRENLQLRERLSSLAEVQSCHHSLLCAGCPSPHFPPLHTLKHTQTQSNTRTFYLFLGV
jgi:hypothetical protein